MWEKDPHRSLSLILLETNKPIQVQHVVINIPGQFIYARAASGNGIRQRVLFFTFLYFFDIDRLIIDDRQDLRDYSSMVLDRMEPNSRYYSGGR